MTAAPRVVLDTKVVLSALVFAQGRLAPLRHTWQDARCIPLVCRATTAELLRALSYPKFKLAGEEQRELLADYLPWCVTVGQPARRPKIPACRDPFDAPFLELAVAGKADYLVTGDKYLLSLSRGLACPIVTPAALLASLAATREFVAQEDGRAAATRRSSTQQS
ncbi:MAG: putative toxin-antitoxin system toxin component, PIN family [Sterolibacteriaceae bacterium]|nr:putative toxin-antitoxin system toxin component, PIN family [Sterolibacteriaceae bacterium]MBK9084519.1 putative toxin-antitoxin system toxin component, PIN family [Sterolibacteriaceae bacterium]